MPGALSSSAIRMPGALSSSAIRMLNVLSSKEMMKHVQPKLGKRRSVSAITKISKNNSVSSKAKPPKDGDRRAYEMSKMLDAAIKKSFNGGERKTTSVFVTNTNAVKRKCGHKTSTCDKSNFVNSRSVNLRSSSNNQFRTI